MAVRVGGGGGGGRGGLSPPGGRRPSRSRRATVAALGETVARIAPTALPSFTRELDEASARARAKTDPAALRRFTAHWSVYVRLQRHPALAARLRRLEQRAAHGTADGAREAASGIGALLDQARAAVAGDAR
ncbi:hypothetical protein AB0J21_18825 [Streptomyces sp. NPDC049954]|uniref:hypothetical protein n=1 Tax=Streptomyces sp. NPDC049954 TaxID=3155779 RepID=UPI00344A1E34